MLKALSGCRGCAVVYDPTLGDVAAPLTGCASNTADSRILTRLGRSRYPEFYQSVNTGPRSLNLNPNRIKEWVCGEPHRQLSLAFMSLHPPILLGTISMVDSVILMIMALVVFGPRRLPQIGRQIGKLMYEFRKASNDFKFQMEEELRQSEEAERRKKEEERQRALTAQAASEQASVSPDPVTAPQPTDSPYPGETTYPEQSPSESASDEPKLDDSSAPRIMPPSIGETVPAARPNRAHGSPDDSPAIEEPGSSQQQSTGIAAPEAAPHSPEAAEALNPHG